MYKRLDRAHRAIPLLGLVTLIALGAHSMGYQSEVFSCQSARRPAAKDFVKAIMLAIAFLFWAANQLWPDLPQVTLFNDFAIALFVLDMFLVIIGWPTTSPDESFAETSVEKP
jgi:uncharacterized membrane protein